MFTKVLVANRGEIAVRIMRTLREMNVGTVAVYAQPDQSAPHVNAADEATAIGGQTPAASYLNVEGLVEAARNCGADAIHPGYGFLSENATFARACESAGIAFIGPAADVIEAMGDKIVARRSMADAGVPILPGCDWAETPTSEDAAARAVEIGYPVLVKAAAGGGGKGMRVVHSADALDEAMAAAGREAGKAFGDARIFLEKYVERPRHVEVQILGDHHGQLVHLFDRECSLQRRHQKIIEEAPSPSMDDARRSELTAAAVRAGQAIGYTGAGTVEFIVDEAGDFYFLEINTRLQVEHGVTEQVVGLDLVRLQVEVAAQQRLPFKQDALRIHGHAIEARICAEDARGGFLPCNGTVERYVEPSGPGIRVDSGVCAGSQVGVHFDPMLAKVIVWAPDRPHAVARLREALRQFVILGVTTNIDYLQDVLDHEDVRAARVHTHFLEETDVPAAEGDPDAALVLAALILGSASHGGRPVDRRRSGPWYEHGPWRGGT
jgi:acetyl-CoA carboxylase biotin carboxylase subunit